MNMNDPPRPRFNQKIKIQVSCSCDPGYTGDPVAGCTKIDQCDPGPCGERADCSSAYRPLPAPTTTTTSAPYSGYSAVPPTSAPAPTEIPAYEAVCSCQPGYTGDPVAGCTKIDQCDPFPCGEKAECRSVFDPIPATADSPAVEAFTAVS